MITIYGIKNCDTVRRAKTWLAGQGIEHRFHDFRADGLDKATLKAWVRELGWEVLLNRRGTTWRKLDDAQKQDVDSNRATDLMMAHPAMIKRPVFDLGTHRLVGFDASVQEELENYS